MFYFCHYCQFLKSLILCFYRDSDVQSGEAVDLGDNVEFTIQTRDGKEVACNITKLIPGTVVFEDVGTEYFRGQVLKPLDRNYRGMTEGDALSGRVKYRGPDRSEKEVQFGETDQVGDFTLKHGDWIKFVIAVDRRDKHPRATKIELLDESFKVNIHKVKVKGCQYPGCLLHQKKYF